MEKLWVTDFNRNQLRLGRGITCSTEQVIKLGLFGYLANLSELRLRQYLVLSEIKFLGGLVDYKVNGRRFYYKGQAKGVKLQLPEGVTELDSCFEDKGIEALRLRGKNVVSLYNLTGDCAGLREVAIDVDFSDEVIDLRWCFSYTKCLERVIFSKAASRAKIEGLFCVSGIKEIRLRNYVLNVEDTAWLCFSECKELVDLDCSGVKFNKGIGCILRDNPKLETISFRDCWFDGGVNLTGGRRFSRPVTIDLRGARRKGLEKVKSLSEKRGKNIAVDEFIARFELGNVTLILD